MGLFPRTSWPAADQAHEQRVHAAIADALRHARQAEPHIGGLISLLSAIDKATKVVDPKAHGIERRELKRRAKAVEEQSWAAAAVRKTVETATASTAAGAAAGAAAAGGSG